MEDKPPAPWRSPAANGQSPEPEWRCTNCGQECEAYESRSRYFSRTRFSLCCRTKVTALGAEGRP